MIYNIHPMLFMALSNIYLHSNHSFAMPNIPTYFKAKHKELKCTNRVINNLP